MFEENAPSHLDQCPIASLIVPTRQALLPFVGFGFCFSWLFALVFSRTLPRTSFLRKFALVWPLCLSRTLVEGQKFGFSVLSKDRKGAYSLREWLLSPHVGLELWEERAVGPGVMQLRDEPLAGDPKGC